MISLANTLIFSKEQKIQQDMCWEWFPLFSCILHVWALSNAKNERQTKGLVPNDAQKHSMLDITKLISKKKKKKDIWICKRATFL